METSIIIARLFALLYILVGVGMLTDTKFYKAVFKDYKDGASSVYYGGLLALVAGFFLITFHNRWEFNVYFPITILGWLGLTKGAILLVYPQVFVRRKMRAPHYYASAILALVLGLYFVWLGFIH